jgi:copper transport protein
MKPRVVLPLLLLAFFLSVSAHIASAHGTLVRSTPESNAQLEKSPAIIELFFSEPIEANFSTIQVLDSTGKRVDNDDPLVDPTNPTRLTVTVRSSPDGIYTVSWKVLSLVDSHVTAGAFPYAVGDVDAAALAAATSSQTANISTGEVIFRWLSFVASAALGGGALFILHVWQPALEAMRKEGKTEPNLLPPWHTLAVAALFLLTLANILGLLFQTGQVIGQEIAAPWNPATYKLLFATKFGMLWLARFVLSLVAFHFLLKPKQNRDYWIAFAAYLLILLTFSFNSHAAAEPRPFFPIGADWLHMVGALTWIGGLVYFIGGLWAVREAEPAFRTRFTAALIPRFSSMAIACVGLLGLTGIYSAYLRVATLDGLFGTLYGRTLIVKTLLALPMFLFGAINLLRTTPTMRQAAQEVSPDGNKVSRFRKLVTTEVGFGVLVLLVTGLFTVIPPVRSIATNTSIRQTASAGDLTIEITITPGRIGINTFTVNLQANGAPLEKAKEVGLQFTPTTVDLPPTQITLVETGNGEYTAEGAFLSLPDTWQVQAVVRREGQFDAFANFDVAVGTTAATNFPWTRINSFLILVSAMLYLLAMRPLESNSKRAWYTLRAPAMGLVLAAVFVYMRPATDPAFLVNPIPPNQTSVAAGQAIYRVQCLPCHGPTGRGDGPVGLTLIPPPADLYLHTQPGVHPDGRLYGWITNGFPSNSQMPIFKQILTDEDRWHLVNYIRTFARDEEDTQTQP